MSLLTQVRVDLAVGFGLFAILSIIRLRSSAVTQQEVAYYFIALVVGLVNGMGVPDRGLVVALNVVLVLTMFAFDSKPLRDRLPVVARPTEHRHEHHRRRRPLRGLHDEPRERPTVCCTECHGAAGRIGTTR